MNKRINTSILQRHFIDDQYYTFSNGLNEDVLIKWLLKKVDNFINFFKKEELGH